MQKKIKTTVFESKQMPLVLIICILVRIHLFVSFQYFQLDVMSIINNKFLILSKITVDLMFVFVIFKIRNQKLLFYSRCVKLIVKFICFLLFLPEP